jgi:hypothetical protein
MIGPKNWPATKVETWDVARIKPYAKNARTHSMEDIQAARRAIDEYGWTYPILVDELGGIIAGHRRFAASQLDPPMEEVPVLVARGWNSDQVKAYRLWDNKSTLSGGWDEGLLRTELGELQTAAFDLSLTGFELSELNVFSGAPAAPSDGRKPTIGNLADKFFAVPFSVLNSREGWWQDRKRAWLALGIESEVGRAGNLLKMSDTVLEPDPVKRAALKNAGVPGGGQALLSGSKGGNTKTETGSFSFDAAEYEGGHIPFAGGTSIFDPVLAELAYRWFCPPKGLVLDPFAGGSVRGIVASKLGRSYLGVDLREEQIAANRAQGKKLCKAPKPEWITGDSLNIGKLTKGGKGVPADLIFSCPPYADLERYSDDPKDLSTMEYGDFIKAYSKIIEASCKLLADDRFAIFVVGDLRDEKGFYRGFHMDTIDAFQFAGLRLYNHAILVTSAGSLAMRAGRAFQTSRKLGTTHQNVMVFIKGDPRKATEAIGEVECGDISEVDDSATAPLATEFGEKVLSIGGEV